MESTFCKDVPAGTLLIETFGWSPHEGAWRIDMHLGRMARSASELGFAFNRPRASALLKTLTGTQPLRCRLTLNHAGQFDLTTGDLVASPDTWRLSVADARLEATDPWLRHKTTQRALFDATRAKLPGGVDEVLFLNRQGELCEGTISTLFLRRAPDDPWLTPAQDCGLLPGILRQHLLDTGVAREARLTMADLRQAQTLAIGNALRGLIPARLVES